MKLKSLKMQSRQNDIEKLVARKKLLMKGEGFEKYGIREEVKNKVDKVYI